MGNSLLDFVLALVRDPAAAARYAADPAGALADAGLPGVTVTDVQSLIPVVTDSVAAATPGFGGAVETANVWTSGAAAAAFDAFDIHIPGIGAVPQHVDQPVVSVPAPDLSTYTDIPVDLPSGSLGAPPDHQPLGEDTPEWTESGVDAGGWQHEHLDPQAEHHPADPGFDFF